jgi:hypothetical protein
MDPAPKRKRGRPRRTQRMVKFSVFVAEADYSDLRTIAKQSERPLTFITSRLIAEGVERWRHVRGSDLFPIPEPASIRPEDDPIDVAAPTETADELIRAAAADLENKSSARPQDTGESR